MVAAAILALTALLPNSTIAPAVYQQAQAAGSVDGMKWLVAFYTKPVRVTDGVRKQRS